MAKSRQCDNFSLVGNLLSEIELQAEQLATIVLDVKLIWFCPELALLSNGSRVKLVAT